MMTCLSQFPQKDPKLLSSFDTTRLPDDSRKVVRSLETGKPYLAEAIGNECCRRRLRTYFIKMQELKDRFRSSILSGNTGLC